MDRRVTKREKAIRKRIEDIENKMQPLQDNLEAARDELLGELSPFKVGDMIKWKNSQGVQTGKVVRLFWWVCETPGWVVHRVKKDGTFEAKTREVREYDQPWLVPEEK